jgi:sterol desaturase/sphingolipid hydroxylase (fatty acid hydroxylase superfamily)
MVTEAPESLLTLEPVWRWLVDSVPLTHSIMFPSVVALTSYHAVCWGFTLWDLWRGREGVDHVIRTCAWPQIKWHVIVNGVSWALMRHALGEEGMTAVLPNEAPAVATFALEVAGCYVVGDFFMYWEHVFMHKILWLRHNVHAMHHMYTSPLYAYNAGWVHPIEITIALSCQAVFPVVAKVHPLSLWFFIATWMLWLVEDHCGDEPVWWSLWHWMPYKTGGGAKPHAVHHAPYTTKNMSFVFGVWDHVFGTFTDPDLWFSNKHSDGGGSGAEADVLVATAAGKRKD